MVYVDDLLFAAPRGATLDHLQPELISIFEARDLGEPKFFLGIKMDQTGSRPVQDRFKAPSSSPSSATS